jgi:hypothetical protein
MFEGNRFKNTQGLYLLKAIFYELDEAGRPNAIYSLKDYDGNFEGKFYPSLRKLYVECEDPTEYNFACQYLDGWTHWKKLTQASFFKDYLIEWREELEVRLRAKGLVSIRQIASTPGKEAFQAQKYLAQAGWKLPDEKASVGRPTKEKVAQEAEKLFKQKTDFDLDYERIMGNG